MKIAKNIAYYLLLIPAFFIYNAVDGWRWIKKQF